MKRRGGVEPSTHIPNAVNEQTTFTKEDDKKQRRRNARKQLDGSMKCLHASLCLLVLAYVLFFAEEHQLDMEEPGSNFQENTSGDNTVAAAAATTTTTKRPYRFPKYGTEEFDRQCPWVTVQGDQAKNCTLYFRPGKTTEGLSSWVGIVAQTLLTARQAGCKIKFDYGEDVNIYETIGPFPHAHAHNNWTVPKGFECLSETNCYTYQHRAEIAKAAGLDYQLQPIPIYRHIHAGRKSYTRDSFIGLQNNLPQFQLETGMACALGGLFNLSPSLSKYEPDLFTTLLPKLHDEETLVMSLYIRTGNTDSMAKREARDGKVDYHNERTVGHYTPHSKCALHLEQEYLAGRIRIDDSDSHTSPSISRVLWLVVTDSPRLKNTMTHEFNGKTIGTDPQQTMTRNITREVIGSRSLGIHSRNTRNVSKSDFADSFLDWYLIGESDVVIDKVGAYTYGETGALRTARPVYNVNDNPCSKIFLVKDDNQD